MLGIICKRLILLILILLVSSFAIAPPLRAAHCVVSRVVILPGGSSGMEDESTRTAYTVQSQASDGETCHAPQTLRFSLLSTGTGSFTSSSGGNMIYSISINSYNRYFYYNHTVGENYTITLSAGYGDPG